MPRASSFARIAGSRSTWLIAALRRSTIGTGVPSGAITTFHVPTSSPGTPASAKVGTLGAELIRAAPITPSARSLPACTIGRPTPIEPPMNWTWPATVSCSAGPVPL